MKRREFLINAAVLAVTPALFKQAPDSPPGRHRDPCYTCNTCNMTKYSQLACKKRTAPCVRIRPDETHSMHGETYSTIRVEGGCLNGYGHIQNLIVQQGARINSHGPDVWPQCAVTATFYAPVANK